MGLFGILPFTVWKTTYCLDGEVNVLSGADRFSGANYNYGTRK